MRVLNLSWVKPTLLILGILLTLFILGPFIIQMFQEIVVEWRKVLGI